MSFKTWGPVGVKTMTEVFGVGKLGPWPSANRETEAAEDGGAHQALGHTSMCCPLGPRVRNCTAWAQLKWIPGAQPAAPRPPSCHPGDHGTQGCAPRLGRGWAGGGVRRGAT